MKDYKLLNDAQIANIVYKVVHQISPKCCSNYATLNKQEKEQCINKLMKKLNIDYDQANYLLNPSTYNYRETLLRMEGRKEELYFSKAILFCRESKGKLMIINISFLLTIFCIILIGIYGLIKNSTSIDLSFLIGLYIAIPIILLLMVPVNIYYQYAYFSYDKFKNDLLINKKLTLKKLKILYDVPIGNRLSHQPDILGMKLLCLTENGKKIRLIYPYKQRNLLPMQKLSKKFKAAKKNLYRKWEFSYLKDTKFIIDSTLSLEKIYHSYMK